MKGAHIRAKTRGRPPRSRHRATSTRYGDDRGVPFRGRPFTHLTGDRRKALILGKVVLVTGAARQLGGRFVRRIQRDPEVDRVIAVDAVAPGHQLGDAVFVRADIRQPAIARVLAEHAVDTVVHLDVSAKALGAQGRTAVKETNVIGTMQLLGACQKSPSVRRMVVKSSTGVYGSAPAIRRSSTRRLRPSRCPAGASRRTRWRSRGTYGASRAAGRTWPCAC